MKEIVIMTSSENVNTSVIEALKSLFPECNLRVVFAGESAPEVTNSASNHLATCNHCCSPVYLSST